MENVCVCLSWMNILQMQGLRGRYQSAEPRRNERQQGSSLWTDASVWDRTYLQMLLNGHISEWHHQVLTWSMTTMCFSNVLMGIQLFNNTFFLQMYLVAKKVVSVQIFMDPTGKGLLDSPFKQLPSLSRSSTNMHNTERVVTAQCSWTASLLQHRPSCCLISSISIQLVLNCIHCITVRLDLIPGVDQFLV